MDLKTAQEQIPREAPLPQLGVPTAESQRQAWSPSAPNDIAFGVHFKLTLKDYMRCSMKCPVFNIPAFILSNLIWDAVSTYLLTTYLLPQHKPHFSYRTYLYIWAGCFVVSIITTPISASWAAFLSALIDKKITTLPRSIVVDTNGIKTTREHTEQMHSWSDIKRIEYRSGDIFIKSKKDVKAFSVPYTAFSGTESALRFYHALVSLWKSRGDSVTLTQEIATEFALEKRDVTADNCNN